MVFSSLALHRGASRKWRRFSQFGQVKAHRVSHIGMRVPAVFDMIDF
jgi:hypothetical protein